jgi:hypothetical protein
MTRTLFHDDVVFVFPAADFSAYAKYGATVVASGGSHDSAYVNKLKRQGLHVAGTVWCLAAHSHDVHANPDLAAAVAKDIEGKPIAVPWLPKSSTSESPAYFGCVNNPAYRAHMRRKVCDAMAGGADGLHVDEPLGSASAALSLGGCFCDFCMAGFASYLAKQASDELLHTAKVETFDAFDYRSFVKNYAPSREQYLSLQSAIPLHREFLDFQLSSACDNVVSLGRLAADVAGRPVSLSANACLPALEHAVFVPHLTYCASEVPHNAPDGAHGLAAAVGAYSLAEALGKPMAATATSQDWSFVKNQNAEQLVCLWIALAYACGQRFMVPHRMLCSAPGGPSQWFCGSTAMFAPLYSFVKKHGFLLNDFGAVGPLSLPGRLPSSFETDPKRQALGAALAAHPAVPLAAGDGAWVFPRVKGDGAVAVHVVNLDYNIHSKRIAAQTNLEVRLPNALFNRNFSGATVYSYGGEPQKIVVTNNGSTSMFVLPEVKLWSIVAFEYWA